MTVAVVALLCATEAGQAQARPAALAAAGSDEHLWIAQPTEGGLTRLVHRHAQDPPEHVHLVGVYRGWVAGSHALAAHGHELWLVYDNQRVQVFEATFNEFEGRWQYESRPMPSLPADSTLRGWAVNDRTAWALVRREGRASGDDAPDDAEPIEGAGGPTDLSIALNLPPGALDQAGEDEAPLAADHAEADEQAPPEESVERQPGGPVDQLLRLDAGEWTQAPLPEDWPHQGPAHVMVTDARASHPLLIVQAAVEQSPQLWVYRRGNEVWDKRIYRIDAGSPPQFVIVQRQLVMGRAGDESDGLRVGLQLIRPQSDLDPVGLGVLELPGASGAGGALAAVSGQAALLAVAEAAGDAANGTAEDVVLPPLTWTRMNLQGQVTLPATSLQVAEPTLSGQAVQQMLFIGMLVLILLMVLLSRQRETMGEQLALPETLALASGSRRALAGVIDAMLGVFVANWLYDMPTGEILVRWTMLPGGATPNAMMPVFVAIAATCVHTTIGELATGRTIGKAFTQLKVVTPDGRRPRWWWLLTRNVVRPIELAMWPVLMLIVLTPTHQRFGDLLSRTVVVMPAPQEDESESDEDDE